MAHAGTPTNLTQHSTTSPTGFWQLFMGAILALALAAGLIAVTANIASQAPAIPAAGHGGQVQTQSGPADLHKVVGHKGAMIYQ